MKLRPEERFWLKVRKTEKCWEWTGALNSNGYGNFWNGQRYVGAHRFSWELAHGEIPDGLWALHRCDNRICVNPDCLFLGNVRDNNRDRAAKGRNGFYGRLGELNHRAILKENQVIEILQRYKNGEMPKTFHKDYGVSRGAITSIVNGNGWKSVKEKLADQLSKSL